LDGDLLGFALRRDIHNPRLLRFLDGGEERLAFRMIVRKGARAEPDVGAIETAHDDARIAHPEPLHDLNAHGEVGLSGQGDHGRTSGRLENGAKPEDLWAPILDAVRLVEDEQRGSGRL